jgi:hypothetical protein
MPYPGCQLYYVNVYRPLTRIALCVSIFQIKRITEPVIMGEENLGTYYTYSE